MLAHLKKYRCKTSEIRWTFYHIAYRSEWAEYTLKIKQLLRIFSHKLANSNFCVDPPAHQVVGQVTREDICCKWSCAAVASVNQRGQLPGSKKRQKIRFWPKLSSHTHQFVQVVHDWVWKRFLPFLQGALSLQHCNPCLHCKYKYKYTILHMQCWICRGPPRYRESHELMQLRRGVCGKNLVKGGGWRGQKFGKRVYADQHERHATSSIA